MPHQGECLCGAVKISIASTIDSQVLCHCNDCKHTSGSAFSTNAIVQTKDVKFEGPIGKYKSQSLAGKTVTRVFCSRCGSALAHQSPGFGEAQAIQTGNLPDFAKIPIVAEVFVKDRWAVMNEIPGTVQHQMNP